MEKALQSSAYNLIPKSQVGPKEFIQHFGNEMDCLRYCARNNDVLSITGLKENIAWTKDGNLTMTLHSLEYCDKLTVFLNTKMSISMDKAYHFLQAINNTEYIYIEGEPKEKNSRRRFYRLPMDEMEHIDCVFDTNVTVIKPPHCNCPEAER